MTNPGDFSIFRRPPALAVPYWQLRTRRLEFGSTPRLMGIVNATPDSFSDGGRYFDARRAVEHALRLVDEGADLIDIGGESTRPYSTPVDVDEELRRVLPVVTEITGRTKVPVSIDTSKARVAREALAAGAEIVNDVTGLEGDPEMVEVVRSTGAGVCAMHMRGTPQTMQDDPRYDDVVAEIHEYLKIRRDRLEAAGIERLRIALDPGIGFGKTHEHNLTLARHCDRFLDLGTPLLVGHSRKGFIGKVLGDKEADRTFGSVGVSLALAVQGVNVLRVHDVAATRQTLTLFAASLGWPR
jgi:dihydropteroate synthase